MTFNQAEYHRAWYKRNKEKMAAYMKEYRENNPDYVKRDNKERTERRRKTKGSEAK